MDPRKLSELAPFLQEKGLSPIKSLSQNFLIDPNILHKIVKTASISKNESVLEIGPGPGALTITLLEHGAQVLAIEKDKRLYHALLESCKDPHLQLIHGDALTFPYKDKMKIVSNIPYHITSDILLTIFFHHHLFSEIFLTVQKDWAERLISEKLRSSTALQVLMHTLYIPKLAFQIPASCFWPKPNVVSALIILKKRENPPSFDIKSFYQFLQGIYQKKRKMIRSIIKDKRLESVFLELGLSSSIRPEEMSRENFLSLFHRIISLENQTNDCDENSR